MVKDYERSTRATTLAALPEPVRGALRARAEALQLTVADDAPAYLTHSRRLRKSGLLARMTKSGDPDSEHLTALVLGARDVHTEDLLGGVVADQGVSLDGFPVSGAEGSGRGSYFAGLGPPEGDAARAALESAIRAAKV